MEAQHKKTSVSADTKTQSIQNIKSGLNALKQNILNIIARNPQFNDFSLSVTEGKTPNSGHAMLSAVTQKNDTDKQSTHAVHFAFGNKKNVLLEAHPSEQQTRGVSTNTSRYMMLGAEYQPIHESYKVAPPKSYSYKNNTDESILKDANRLIIERCLPTGFATIYQQSLRSEEPGMGPAKE